METLPIAAEIAEFIRQAMPDFIADAKEYDGMDLTIATNDTGTEWNYQTGDNSYTGGAYGLPHWAVTTVYPDTTAEELTAEIIDQLLDLIPENR